MNKFVTNYYHLNAPQELMLVRLLTNIGSATVVATISLYLHSLGMSAGVIGIMTSLVMIANLLFALWLPAILETHNLSKLLIGSTLSFALTLFIFGQVENAFFALFLYLIGRLLLSTYQSSYSILFRDDSPSKEAYRRNIALSGSLGNFSWMITPFLATLIIDEYSFSALYLFSGVVVVLASLIMIIQKIPTPEKNRKTTHDNIFENIKYYFKQKRLRDAYLMGAGVDMWWVFVFVFLTVFLKDSGYSTSEIGLLLTITQTPLFLLEFRTYKIVERFRFKLPFSFSYGLLSVIMIIFAIFGPTSVISLLFLVLGSFSMVFVEPAREMYLYDKLKEIDEERVQPIYATSELFGSIFIRFIIGLVLLIFSPVISFLFMAFFMGYLTLVASRIKN